MCNATKNMFLSKEADMFQSHIWDDFIQADHLKWKTRKTIQENNTNISLNFKN